MNPVMFCALLVAFCAWSVIGYVVALEREMQNYSKTGAQIWFSGMSRK